MPVPFTLTQLHYFSLVAETESMTVAAGRLRVTQSTVSSAIATLEKSLGVQLFLRLPRRGLKLSPAGRLLAQDARRLLEQADSIAASAHGVVEALVGELRVGIFAPLAPFRAPVILQEFEAAHPGMRVSFLEGDQDLLQEAVREGRCDIALMYGIGVAGGVSTEVIERIPPHVIVAESHPLAVHAADGISLTGLGAEPMILLDLPHSRDYYLGLFNRVGVVPNVRHRASGYETVRSFVARGHGYAVLNQRLPHESSSAGGRVVVLPLTDPLPPIDVVLARPRNVPPTRRVLAFEAACRRIYGVPMDAATPDLKVHTLPFPVSH